MKAPIIMTKQPLFTFAADGTICNIQPAGLLLIMADLVYEPHADPAWTGKPRTKFMIESLLSAARASGYTQTDILQTLLARGNRSQRVQDLARAACAAVGSDRIGEIFGRMQ